MSHIETIKAAISDLEALRATCARLGVEFHEGQKTFVYYANQNGQCAHAIRIPGVTYEVGLKDSGAKTKLGRSIYDLQCDWWGGEQFGLGVQRKLCRQAPGGGYTRGFEGLKEVYSAEVIKRAAVSKGLRSVESRGVDGRLRVSVTGNVGAFA